MSGPYWERNMDLTESIQFLNKRWLLHFRVGFHRRVVGVHVQTTSVKDSH